jgi:hypothetical protein
MAIRYSKNPSKNRKIAKLSDDGKQALWPYAFATYRRVGDTCPIRCGFHPDREGESRVHGSTCYARKGRVPLHASKATPDQTDGDTIYRWIQGLPPESVVRHHVSGDVYSDGETLDWAYFVRLCEAHEARPDVKGWLYTHGSFADFQRMRARAPKNLAVNWSCDDLTEAQAAQADGAIGLTAVVEPDADRQRGVTICPQQTSGIPCVDCGLCMVVDRKTIVGFLAH